MAVTSDNFSVNLPNLPRTDFTISNSPPQEQIFSNKCYPDYTPKYSKWQLINELKELYIEARQYLLENNHEHVWQALKLFLEQDIYLRGLIAKALRPLETETDEIPSEDELNFLIEYQSMAVNNFRLKLIGDITDLLIDKYDQAISIYEINIQYGSKIAHEASKTYEYYNCRLNEFYTTEEESIQYQLFKDIKEAFDTVKQSGEKNLAQLTAKVLDLENKLAKNHLSNNNSHQIVGKNAKSDFFEDVKLLAYKINNIKLENSLKKNFSP
jgi:hypothetical protein